MDLSRARILLSFSLITIGIASPALAAGKLRLDTTAVGPISVALGTNGPSQTVNAANAGDAALNLSVSSSASWLVPTVGKLQSCGTLGNCNPISIALNTTPLSRGTVTGTITVTDPNAIDAPQTITVTVAVGGGIPDNLTLYVPANGTPVTRTLSTAKAVSTTISAPSQVALSIAAPGGGSFATTFSYTLTAKANAGAADGTYGGSFTVSGSSIGSENKTVPLTLNVTSQPVAALASKINGFRIAQGTAKQTQYILISNLSGGTLTLSDPKITTSSGTWLTGGLLAGYPGYVGITADVTGLSVGSYQGTVTVASNAPNSIDVPVTLDVLAPGSPVVQAGGVVNNATFESGLQLAQGELPAIFGEQFTTGDPQQATKLPLPTTLGGASVFVNDQAAPVYYVSANQINFQIPYEAADGISTLRVDRDGQRGNTVSLTIAKRAPKLLVAVDLSGAIASSPFGGPGVPVKAGSVITIYALGLGQTTPAATTGAAAPQNPLATVPGLNNQVFFGAGGLFTNPKSQTPQFLGLAPGFVGLYQINVQIPSDAPKGAAVQAFLQGDVGTSNILKFNIQ